MYILGGCFDGIFPRVLSCCERNGQYILVARSYAYTYGCRGRAIMFRLVFERDSNNLQCHVKTNFLREISIIL